MNRIIALFGLSLMGFSLAQGDAVAQIATNEAQKSPWGPADEIGTLNMMTDASRLDILKRIAGGKVYDLGVDLFPGMPTCCIPFGDPNFQIFMTHAPGRDPAKELLSYSGDGVTMYLHSGTHIDALNHFGLHGKIWNQVRLRTRSALVDGANLASTNIRRLSLGPCLLTWRNRKVWIACRIPIQSPCLISKMRSKSRVRPFSPAMSS